MEAARSQQEDTIAQVSEHIHQEMDRFKEMHEREFKEIMVAFCQVMLDFHKKNLETWKQL